MPIILVARLKAKEEHIDFIKAGLQGLVAPTLKETGCIKYVLHQDQKDPSVFIFIEEWASEEDLNNHSGSDHVKAFGKAAAGMMMSRELHILSKV